jgi:putative endonuclease
MTGFWLFHSGCHFDRNEVKRRNLSQHLEWIMDEKTYCVYIVANERNSVLYIGVTSNLIRRIYEHKQHLVKGFTDKYNCSKLVYYESTDSVLGAIMREKQLKKWSRSKKEALIDTMNPERRDLYQEILGE